MSGSHLLKPFAAGEAPPVRLEAELCRRAGLLLLSYLLRGPLAELEIPEQTGVTERRDGLWRRTCFELFLAPEGGREYWEVNLSPAGYWNVYVFDDYRTGMRPAPVNRPAFRTVRKKSSLAMVMEFRLDQLAPDGIGFAAGPAAVLATRSGALSYWALDHPAAGADFHRHEFFTVSLAACP